MPEHKTSDRIYAALKSDVMNNQVSIGSINITSLARRYGTSATPVREALLRLVGEILLTLPVTGGFAQAALTARELGDLYDLSMRLLLTASKLNGDRAPPLGQTASELQPPVDALFFQICAWTGNMALAGMMANVNDRLHRARRVEPLHVVAVAEEYRLMSNSNGPALRARIRRYHRRRMQLAERIVVAVMTVGLRQG